jgi:hypothetical protein
MKTFKDFEAFRVRNAEKIAWDDYFTVGGRLFKLYEYGGGSLFNMPHDYAYFVNKRTRDAIKVEYDCPSFQYRDGVRVQTKEYRLIGIDYIPAMDLWRTDTL